MKTIILYYSRSGTTRVIADKKVKEINCDIEEILDVKKPSMFSAMGGGTKKSLSRTKELVNERGCEVIAYTDLKVKRKKGEVFSQVIF
jgi:menaquinone-dependent protoporphyrinogen IX oxidase